MAVKVAPTSGGGGGKRRTGPDRSRAPHPTRSSGGGGGSRPSPTPTYTPSREGGGYATPSGVTRTPSVREVQRTRDRGPQVSLKDQRISNRLQQIRSMVPETEGYWTTNPRVIATAEERAEQLDRLTGGSLHPDIVIAMSQLEVYNKDVREVSGVLARALDLPKGIYLEGMRVRSGEPRNAWEYIDPTTGEPISARDAHRYFPVYERAFWEHILETTPGEYVTTYRSSGARRRRGKKVVRRGDAPIDPVWVGAGFGVLAKHAGKDISWKSAIAIAVNIAQNQVNTTLMSENLDSFLAAKVPVKQAVAAAQLSAMDKRQIRNRDEALAYMAQSSSPSVASGDEDAYGILRSREEIEQDLKSNDPAVRGEALRALDYYDMMAKNENVNPDEAIAYQVASQEGDMTMAQRISKLGKEYTDYAKAMDEAEAYIGTGDEGLDLYGIPIIGPALKHAAHLYDVWDTVVFDRIRRGAADVMNEIDYTYRKLVTDDTAGDVEAKAWHDQAVERANDIGKGPGQIQFHEFLQEEYGFSPFQSFIFDLGLTWYADPFIVGGKAFKLARVQRFNRASVVYKYFNGAERFARYAERLTTRKKHLFLGGRTLSDASVDHALAISRGTKAKEEAATVLEKTQNLGITDPVRSTGIRRAVHNGSIDPGALPARDFGYLYSRTQEKIQAARAANKLPDDETTEIWDLLTGKGRFKDVASDNPQALWEAHKLAMTSNAARHYTHFSGLIKPKWKGHAVDDKMLDWIFRYVKEMDGVIPEEAIRKNVAEVWASAGGSKHMADTEAYRFLKEMSEDAANRPPTPVYKTLDDVDTVAIKQEARAERAQELYESAVGFGGGYVNGYQMLSIPKARAFGLVKEFAARYSPEIYETIGDSRLAAAGRALRTRYRDPYLSIEDDLPRRVAGLLRRSREFTPDEIAHYQRQAVEIARATGPQREQRFVQLGREIEQAYWRREGRRAGLSQDVIDAIYKKYDEGLGVSNVRPMKFSAIAEDSRPVFETQLRNRMLMTDPVEVRRLLHAHVRTTRLLNNYLHKAVGRKLEFGVNDLISAQGSKAYISPKTGTLESGGRALRYRGLDMVKNSIDGFYRFWKPLVVVTPRYVGRVVMTNETARFIADVGLIGRMTAGKTFSKTVGRVLPRPTTTFHLDPSRTSAILREITNAGFDNMEQAVFEARRALKVERMGSQLDPRLAQLTQETRDLLSISKVKGGFLLDETGPLAGTRWLSDDGKNFRKATGPRGDAVDTHQPFHVGAKGQAGDWEFDPLKYDDYLKNKGETWVNNKLEELGYDSVLNADGTLRVWDPNLVVHDVDSRLKVTLYKPRAGEILDDARVKPGLGKSEFYETFARIQRNEIERIKAGKYGWGPVTENDKVYWETWSHHLNNSLGRSVVAREVLLDLYRGGTPETARAALKRFLTGTPEGRAAASRLKIDKLNINDKTEEMVNEITRVTLYGTGRNTELVGLALNHKATGSWLTQYANSNQLTGMLPDLHSMKVLGTGGEDVNLVTRLGLDKVYRVIMQDATNRIVRQPFFKRHFVDARQAMLDTANYNGLELTPELINSIEGQARQFAAQRVQDVMFDFAEQGRFAELLHYVAPFAQPFFEEYTVWGKLLMENPGIAAGLAHAFETGKETGAIEKDPLTGDWQFRLPHWAGGNIWSTMLGGEGGILPGYGIMGNLTSFNMFTQNVLPIPIGELGEIGVPLPGFSPPVQWVVQRISDNERIPTWLRPNVAEWATQYGTIDLQDFVPAWMKDVADGIALKMGIDGVFQKDMIQSIKNEFIKEMYARGVTTQDVMEAKGLSHEQAQAYIASVAEDQAATYMLMKGASRAILPMSFQIEGPLQGYSDELRGYFQEMDYKSAIEKFKRNHIEMDDPALMALTLSETVWAGTEDIEERQESGAISLPANPVVNQLMQDERFLKYLKGNPTLAFAILPDEVWDAEFDRRAYFEQIEQGWRAPKDSFQFLAELDEKLYLDQYMQARNMWYQNREILTNKGIQWNSVTGQVNNFPGIDTQRFEEIIDNLDEMYPGAADRVKHMEGIGMDPNLVGQLTTLVSTPAGRSTELGRATKKYLDGALEIQEDMWANNIYDVDQAEAEELGIPDAIYELEQQVVKEHPSFSRIHDVLFGDFFSNVDVRRSELGNVFEGFSAQERDEALQYDVQFSKAWNAANNAVDDDEAIPHYMKMRQMSYDSYYNSDTNPQKLWERYILGDAGRREYTRGARVRPYLFMSVFDRKLLGIKTTKAAEQRWLQVGQLEQDIARIRANNPDASSADLYAQRDRFVRQYMKTSKVFRRQVKEANTWGFAFFHENPWLKNESEASRAWAAFRDSLHATQRDADRLGMTGEYDSDYHKRNMYKDAKEEMSNYVEQLFDYSPVFERQWGAMDEAYGGDLIDYFFPVYNFKLGGS